MSFCKVSYDTTMYYKSMDDQNEAFEWVENGPVKSVICQDCGLFFATFERAESSTCGRCQNKKLYPWVNGKRAKWTNGPIMNESNIHPPERDYGC